MVSPELVREMDKTDGEGRVFWHWMVAVGIGAAIVAWGSVQYLYVEDTPREWSFGSLPETPAQSKYSTETPEVSKKVEQQMQTLPEAKPLKKQEGQQ